MFGKTNLLMRYVLFLAMVNAFVISFSSLITVQAQSDNYWSWNFNTPSTLLAGSVVGGSAGPSAIFYNPAINDHEKVPSLSLSASLVSFQFFNAKITYTNMLY